MRLARVLPKVKAPRYLGKRSWILYWLVFNVHARFCTSSDRGIVKTEKSEPAAFKKAGKLLTELQEHPKTGTGKPEPLSGDRAGQWSRRISQKHRLVYEIEGTIVKVDVLSAYGHYEDK